MGDVKFAAVSLIVKPDIICCTNGIGDCSGGCGVGIFRCCRETVIYISQTSLLETGEVYKPPTTSTNLQLNHHWTSRVGSRSLRR